MKHWIFYSDYTGLNRHPVHYHGEDRVISEPINLEDPDILRCPRCGAVCSRTKLIAREGYVKKFITYR